MSDHSPTCGFRGGGGGTLGRHTVLVPIPAFSQSDDSGCWSDRHHQRSVPARLRAYSGGHGFFERSTVPRGSRPKAGEGRGGWFDGKERIEFIGRNYNLLDLCSSGNASRQANRHARLIARHRGNSRSLRHWTSKWPAIDACFDPADRETVTSSARRRTTWPPNGVSPVVGDAGLQRHRRTPASGGWWPCRLTTVVPTSTPLSGGSTSSRRKN
jgi:hypothetical protein